MTQTEVAFVPQAGSSHELDRVAGSTFARGASPLRVFAPVAVGLLLGTWVGLGLGILDAPEPAATARVEIVPDPSPSGTVLDSTQANRFVQGQVLVLSGDDLQAQAQANQSGNRALAVTATQVEATDVVELKVVASTQTEALTLTQNLIDAYSADRAQAFTSGLDSSIAVVDGQLETLRGSSVYRTSGADEYNRLLGLRNNLQLTRDTARVEVPVVLRPRLDDQSRWPGAVRNAFVGLVLGGLLGLLVKLVIDRSSRRQHEAPLNWA